MNNDDPENYLDTAHFAVLGSIGATPKTIDQFGDEACEALGRYISRHTIKCIVRRCVREGILTVHERSINGRTTYIDTEAKGNQDQPARSGTG